MRTKILVGVTGSIAAYKTPYLIRGLKQAGCDVRVILTSHAKEFVTPSTLEALSGSPVHDHLFNSHEPMEHILSARWADCILIAPASANFLAKLAHGFADDLLSSLCLAASVPIVIAPAMNQQMWQNSTTQENISKLKARGIQFLGPAEGIQACGEEGPGRMLEPEEIVKEVLLADNLEVLCNKHVVISAGPTHEAIDPVRFISNRSSGKMGYALAQAALNNDAHVTLISGPVCITPPFGCRLKKVVTAQEMLLSVLEAIKTADIFISTAAVADYTPSSPAIQKIKKNNATLTLTLDPTPDILLAASQAQPKPFLVGFAAETEDGINQAEKKRVRKGVDLMIVNDVSQPDIGFDSDENSISILSERGILHWDKAPKILIAQRLITLIASAYEEASHSLPQQS